MTTNSFARPLTIDGLVLTPLLSTDRASAKSAFLLPTGSTNYSAPLALIVWVVVVLARSYSEVLGLPWEPRSQSMLRSSKGSSSTSGETQNEDGRKSSVASAA